jgi:hypothetical protein
MVWKPSNFGWHKFNFDEVAKGNPIRDRIRGIISDCRGKFMIAEAMALVMGI